jgi:hypothetical protein
VLGYLLHRHRAMFRRKLQAAYEEPMYEKAKRALSKIRAEQVLLNASAANSLDEGLEEKLTLHRLGVFAELGTNLKTTNALESIRARVQSRTAKVDHWKNSEQKQRWLATALLDVESRPRHIRNYRALPMLRERPATAAGIKDVGCVNRKGRYRISTTNRLDSSWERNTLSSR